MLGIISALNWQTAAAVVSQASHILVCTSTPVFFLTCRSVSRLRVTQACQAIEAPVWARSRPLWARSMPLRARPAHPQTEPSSSMYTAPRTCRVPSQRRSGCRARRGMPSQIRQHLFILHVFMLPLTTSAIAINSPAATSPNNPVKIFHPRSLTFLPPTSITT